MGRGDSRALIRATHSIALLPSRRLLASATTVVGAHLPWMADEIVALAVNDQPATIEALQRAIKDLHGLDATYRDSVEVVEKFMGKLVWSGEVHVFDVSPRTVRACYAWVAPNATGEADELIAVLSDGPITSPVAAVRAWNAVRAKSADENAPQDP
jgi:hypothetical protein